MKNRKSSQKFKPYFKPQKFLGTFFSETLFLVPEIYLRGIWAENFCIKKVARCWPFDVLPLSSDVLI